MNFMDWTCFCCWISMIATSFRWSSVGSNINLRCNYSHHPFAKFNDLCCLSHCSWSDHSPKKSFDIPRSDLHGSYHIQTSWKKDICSLTSTLIPTERMLQGLPVTVSLLNLFRFDSTLISLKSSNIFQNTPTYSNIYPKSSKINQNLPKSTTIFQHLSTLPNIFFKYNNISQKP